MLKPWQARSSLELLADSPMLRPWQADDLTSLMTMAANPNVRQYMNKTLDAFDTVPSTAAWLQANSAGTLDWPLVNLAIQHDGEAIGGMGLLSSLFLSSGCDS